MKRIKKLVLLQIRSLSLRYNRTRMYYWAELRLFDLRDVTVLPEFYYRFLFRLSMRLVQIGHFRMFADRAIHTIPYHVRFNIA
ncbi:hypothetical protein DSCA_53800 [Desulfosarcina alkanivorans]|jgi:hypothetical protein|uniref:Uncharacterized protein n=1 Tax=Desulfosarcina alkanivorans TaxID=571177 RepID=A0A5K7YT15_9BACT|nr:hypothetical protein DSCA_53800 [Desulfosarcina alkanivorans]